MPEVQFIAEVSSNHSRDLGRSKAFIDAAADVGCTGVKFQLFKIEELFAPEILTQSEAHRNRKRWELPLEFLPELSRHARSKGLQFGCTPFYLDAVAKLEDYIDFYKIASYELLWLDLFRAVAATGKPLVFSTGMATLDEIEAALSEIAGSATGDITVLHCTSAYPTPIEEANLGAIDTLRTSLHTRYSALNLKIGYSDHTVSAAVIHRAVLRYGASMVEFHLDLDKLGEEYSSGHCWLPEEIAPVIQSIKDGFRADGTGNIEPTPSELPDRDWRADPADGLRPLKQMRAGYSG